MAAPIAYSNPSMTPTDVDGRRKVAQALYGQATDASPVGHWTQALARVLQGGVSGFYDGTASRGEKEGIASRGAFMQQAMKDPSGAATAGITNPWTTDQASQIGQKVIAQNMQRSDPAYQMGLKQKQAELDMMPLKRQAMEAEIAGKGLSQQVTQANLEQAKMQTPQWRMQNAETFGIVKGTPEWRQFVVSGSLPDASSGKPPVGYRPTQEGNLEAVPGGPADIKQNEKRQGDFASLQYLNQKLDDLSTQANILKEHPGLPGITGVRGMIPNLPGTKAADAEAERTTLLAKTAFATLQDMRNASKSGGALGAIAVQELVMLQNAVVALEKSQGTDQFKANLGRLQEQVAKTKDRVQAAYNDHWNRSGSPPQGVQGAQGNAGPVRIRDDSDYARLPPGTQYIDPEGNPRTKR